MSMPAPVATPHLGYLSAPGPRPSKGERDALAAQREAERAERVAAARARWAARG